MVPGRGRGAVAAVGWMAVVAASVLLQPTQAGEASHSFGTGGDDRNLRMAADDNGSAVYFAYSTMKYNVTVTRMDPGLENTVWTWVGPVPDALGTEFVMALHVYSNELLVLSVPSRPGYDPSGTNDVWVYPSETLTLRRFNKATGAVLLDKTFTTADTNWVAPSYTMTLRGSAVCNDKLYLALKMGHHSSYSKAIVQTIALADNSVTPVDLGTNFNTQFCPSNTWSESYACNVHWITVTCAEVDNSGNTNVYVSYSNNTVVRLNGATNAVEHTMWFGPYVTGPYWNRWRNDANKVYPGRIGMTRLHTNPKLVTSGGERLFVGVHWPYEWYYSGWGDRDWDPPMHCVGMSGQPRLTAVRTSDLSEVWTVKLPVKAGADSPNQFTEPAIIGFTAHSFDCPTSEVLLNERGIKWSHESGWNGYRRLSNYYLLGYANNLLNEAQHIAFTSSGDIVIAYPNSRMVASANSMGGFDTVVALHSRVDGSQISITQIGSAGHDYTVELHVVADQIYVTMIVTAAYGSLTFAGGQTDVIAAQVQVSPCQPGTYESGVVPRCVACAAGTYSSVAGAGACFDCGVGQVSAAGASSCTPCPKSTYTTDNVNCLPCPAGSYSSTDGSTQCQPCDIGYYADTPGTSECKACPKGEYIGTVGATACLTCSNGGTTKSTASTSKDLCQCGDDYYGDPENDVACVQCPKNTQCSFGQRYPYPLEGFFVSQLSPSEVLNCWPSSACPGLSLSTCDDGYTGSGCRECESGYWREEGTGKCLECSPSQTNFWLGIAILLALLVIAICAGLVWTCIIAVLVSTFAIADIGEKNYKTFLVIMSMQKSVFSNSLRNLYQVIGTKFLRLFQFTALTLAIPIDWPVSYTTLMSPMNALTFSTGDVTRIDCWAGSSSSSIKIAVIGTKLILLSATPTLFALAYLAVASCCCRCGTTDTRSSRLSTLLSVFWRFWDLVYLPVHTGIVATLSCYDSGDGLAMRIEPSVKCYSSDPQWMVPWMCALVAFGFVSLGVPWAQAASIWFCVSPRHAERGKMLYAKRIVRVSLDSFTSSYEERYFFWPCVDMLGKFLLPLGYLLSSTGSNESDSLVYMTFVSFFFICAQLMAWPYAHKYEDTIDAAVKLFFFMLSFSGYVFLAANVSEYMKRFLEACVVGSLVLLLTVAVIFVVLLLYDEGRPALAYFPCCKCLRAKETEDDEGKAGTGGVPVEVEEGSTEVVTKSANPFRPSHSPNVKSTRSSSRLVVPDLDVE